MRLGSHSRKCGGMSLEPECYPQGAGLWVHMPGPHADPTEIAPYMPLLPVACGPLSRGIRKGLHCVCPSPTAVAPEEWLPRPCMGLALFCPSTSTPGSTGSSVQTWASAFHAPKLCSVQGISLHPDHTSEVRLYCQMSSSEHRP